MKLKYLLLAALTAAVTASPAAAGIVYDWEFDGCGGTNFQTCISGGVYVSGNTIVVDITNDGPGVMTAVGLWNLPVGILPTDASTTLSGWDAPDSDINGVVSPSQLRYAIGTTNGINDGIGVGGSGTFTFTFTSSDLSNINIDDLGVGAHMQGYGSCSSKVYLLADGTEANPFGGQDNCVSVPEPGSLLLLGTGMAGVAFIRRRRNGVDLVDQGGNDLET